MTYTYTMTVADEAGNSTGEQVLLFHNVAVIPDDDEAIDHAIDHARMSLRDTGWFAVEVTASDGDVVRHVATLFWCGDTELELEVTKSGERFTIEL